MTKQIVLLLAVTLAAHGLSAQDRNEIATKSAMSPDAVAGKAAFQQNCGFCHGQDARGASGPDLIRSTLVNHDVDGNLIGEVVHNGRPEKGMPPFQLPDAQIRQIAAFLHAQSQLASTVASRVPTEYPLEKLLVGNADAGKAYFNGTGNCSKCHSPAGDMAHIASKYTPLELQSRIAFPESRKPTANVTDAAGHQFSGELAYSDEFFVTLLMGDGTQRTWQRNAVKLEVHDPLDEHVALLNKYTNKDIHDLFAYLETLK